MVRSGGGPADSDRVKPACGGGLPSAVGSVEACDVLGSSAQLLPPSAADFQAPTLAAPQATSEPKSREISHPDLAGHYRSTGTISMHRGGADDALASAQQAGGMADSIETGPASAPSADTASLPWGPGLDDEEASPFEMLLSSAEEEPGVCALGAMRSLMCDLLRLTSCSVA